MHIGNIIQKYLNDNNMSQRQFATKCGLSNGYISMLINNVNPKNGKPVVPSLTSLASIAHGLGMQLDDLLKEADDLKVNLSVMNKLKITSSSTNNDKNTPSPNAIFLDEHKVYMIPLYENVSAGFGVLPINEVTEYIPLYFGNSYEAKESICIKVRGDSMYPKIENDDVILVHKQDYIDSGAIAVLLIDDEEGVVKKIAYGEDWIELQSINPMYPPMRFEGADMSRIRVVGAVRKIIKEV